MTDYSAADMVTFARKYKGWHTYALDRLTLAHLTLNIKRGLLKVNQYRQFSLAPGA